jgi:hypothetical protein
MLPPTLQCSSKLHGALLPQGVTLVVLPQLVADAVLVPCPATGVSCEGGGCCVLGHRC